MLDPRRFTRWLIGKTEADGMGPPSGFVRRFAGRGPFSEAWFGKVDIAPGQAFWFRFTILDGAIREAGTWAIWFDDGEVSTGKTVIPLDRFEPDRSGPGRPDACPLKSAEGGGAAGRIFAATHVFHAESGHLDGRCAAGRAGPISFDIRWEHSGREHDLVPELLARARLARSTYSSSFIDVRMTGHVERAGHRVDFVAATGMVGHIFGTRLPQGWAWAHCNCFDGGEDAVFEGLSARIRLTRFVSPPLSSFVLFVGAGRFEFSSPLHLVRASSRHSLDEWTFSTRSRAAELSGRAVAPSSVAVVRYTDTDGSPLWCHNSKLARLELMLTEHRTGRTTRLVSSRSAAFEVVTRVPPDRAVDL